MTFSDTVGDESDGRVLENCMGEDQQVMRRNKVSQFGNQGRIMNDPTKESARINIFKTFTLKWWQTGLFKWGMLALGIAIGAYWHDLFGGYLLILISMAMVALAYVTYVWWKQ